MKFFGTDGIRGRVNKGFFTPEFVQRLGYTIARSWEAGSDRPVLIGHDGRQSAGLLKNALCSGILGAGGHVVDVGFCTTPALSFLASKNLGKNQPVAGAMMISASHNPYPDNGLKPFNPEGRKLTREEEASIEEELERSLNWSESTDVGREHSPQDPLKPYVTALRNRLEQSELSVLVDGANGGGSNLVQRVFEGKVKKLHVVNNRPDGQNINRNCGSLHVEKLKDDLIRNDCDLGFALDGDGDRVLGLTPEGHLIDGDRMLYLLARYGEHPRFKRGIAMTVMSNLALRRGLQNHDIPHQMTPVGDREVHHALKEQDWILGGEQSGHIIDRGWLPTGDGLNTILLLLDLFSQNSSKIEDMVTELEPYPQVLHNQPVPAKPALTSLSDGRELIEDVEDRMGDRGRVLVRYSGTEPLLRVMLEGDGSFPLEEWAKGLATDLLDRIEAEVNAP